MLEMLILVDKTLCNFLFYVMSKARNYTFVMRSEKKRDVKSENQISQ